MPTTTSFKLLDNINMTSRDSTMHRRLSIYGLLLIIINGTVGSAWLFTPLYSAQIAGPYAIIAWIIGGAMTICIALTFATASARLPLAGGTTELAELTHSGFTAFIISWIAWLASVTMPAVEVQAVLQYASIYFPWLTSSVNNVHKLSHYGFICAIFLIICLAILNIISLKNIVRSNFLILGFKLTVILLTIIALITVNFHTSNFAVTENLKEITAWKNILSAVATGGIVFAFTGFKHGVELAGESKNPKKTIPIAIIGSILLCLMLYMGLQIAFIGSIQPEKLQFGWEHLTFSGDIGPFAGIAKLLGLVILVKLLMIDAAVSPLGAASVYVSSTARISYAMSKNGYFPKFLTHLNKNAIPVRAIILNSFVSLILFLPLPGWQNMVSFLVSIIVISYAMGPISLAAMQQHSQVKKKKFKISYINGLTLIGFYFCNLISYWTGWQTVSKLIFALSIGLIIYLSVLSKTQYYSRIIAKNHLTKIFKISKINISSFSWLIPYFIGLTTLSYLGSFGGKHIIPFGWDFLVIAIFSLGIFNLALFSARNKKPQMSKNEICAAVL